MTTSVHLCEDVQKKKRQSREIFSFSSRPKESEKKECNFCLLKNKKATDRHMREERDLVYFLIKSR